MVTFRFCQNPDEIMRPVSYQKFGIYTIVTAFVLELLAVCIGLLISIKVAITKIKIKIRMRRNGPSLEDIIIMDGNVFFYYSTGIKKDPKPKKLKIEPEKKKRRKRKTKVKKTKKVKPKGIKIQPEKDTMDHTVLSPVENKI